MKRGTPSDLDMAVRSRLTEAEDGWQNALDRADRYAMALRQIIALDHHLPPLDDSPAARISRTALAEVSS